MYMTHRFTGVLSASHGRRFWLGEGIAEQRLDARVLSEEILNQADELISLFHLRMMSAVGDDL